MSEPRTRDRNYSDFIDELGLVYVKGQELSAQDLAHLVKIGEAMGTQSQWLRGDVSNLAKQLYGDEWYSHLSYTIKPETLNNYGSIANTFSRERRRWKLPFRYYDAVKGIKDQAIQESLLDRAVEEQITSDVLRDLVRESKATKTRRINKPMQVGLIDITLLEDYGIEEGTEVRVSFEIVVPEKAAA